MSPCVAIPPQFTKRGHRHEDLRFPPASAPVPWRRSTEGLAWSTAIRSRLNLSLDQALPLRSGLSSRPAAVRLLGAGDVQLYCSISQVEPIEDTSENWCSPRPIYLRRYPTYSTYAKLLLNMSVPALQVRGSPRFCKKKIGCIANLPASCIFYPTHFTFHSPVG